MRGASVWKRLLEVERMVVEEVEFDEDAAAVVAHVRPRKRARQRCGRCGARAGWYDRGEGRRRWRDLDLATTPMLLEADAPRVNCPTTARR